LKRDQLIFLGALVVAAVIAVLVVLATGGDDDGDPAEGTKPQVDVPEGPPPKQLEVRDITEGDGAEASAGDTVEVEYLGVSYSNGREFDSRGSGRSRSHSSSAPGG